MATNPYFNKNYSSQSEQDLYDDLMEESIKIHGIDVSYLPRDVQKIDYLFKDVEVSRFNTTHDIEMFVRRKSPYKARLCPFRLACQKRSFFV